MTLVVAFDPGIKHLGTCVLDDDDGTVVEWKSVDVSGGVRGFYASIHVLDSIVRRARTVIIERQPPHNPGAVQIQHWLELYVHSTNPTCHIELLNAQSRVAFVRRQRPDLLFGTYAQRKKSSVQYVKALIRGTSVETVLDDARKKDDLAEAFIMATMVRRTTDSTTISDRMEEYRTTASTTASTTT